MLSGLKTQLTSVYNTAPGICEHIHVDENFISMNMVPQQAMLHVKWGHSGVTVGHSGVTSRVTAYRVQQAHSTVFTHTLPYTFAAQDLAHTTAASMSQADLFSVSLSHF